MKSCNEMVNSLLERREQYAAEQKQKKKTIMRITSVACSFAVVLILGTGVWQGGLLDRTPEAGIGDSDNSGEQDYLDATNGKKTDNQAENDKINIVKINGISSEKSNICLLADDFIPLTADKLVSYYGINIFPTVPSDLGTEWEERNGNPRGIYKRDGGVGEVYYDKQILNYSNEDFSRSVNIELCKDHMPMSDYGFLDSSWLDAEMSVINNTKVGIGQTDDGYYLVEFMYKDVGFRLIGEGITQEELVSVIGSIIK